MFASSKHFFPLNTGHRGFNGKFPENTFASFDAAVEAGAEVVEFDVQVASDGMVVVSHDPNTQRCFGVDHEITKTPYSNVLEKLLIRNPDLEDDSKSLSSASDFPKPQILSESMQTKARNLQSPQSIPTFREIAHKFAKESKYQNIRLMIDIKMTNEPWIVGKLVDILREVNEDLEGFWAPRTVLGIWRLDVLKAAEKNAPQFKVAHIGVNRALARRFMASPQVSAISMNHIALTAGSGGHRLIADAKANGKLVYAWTVNSPEIMKWAIAKDLDGIITDYPDLYSKLRGELTNEVIEKVYKAPKAANQFISWADRNVRNLCIYYVLNLSMLFKMTRILILPSREFV